MKKISTLVAFAVSVGTFNQAHADTDKAFLAGFCYRGALMAIQSHGSRNPLSPIPDFYYDVSGSSYDLRFLSQYSFTEGDRSFVRLMEDKKLDYTVREFLIVADELLIRCATDLRK